MTKKNEAKKLRLLGRTDEVQKPSAEPSLCVAVVKPLLRYFYFHNPKGFEQFLKRWGLAREILSLGDLSISQKALMDIWLEMAKLESQNEIAGFEAASTFDYSDLGLLGLLFSSAETPGELLNLQERYFGRLERSLCLKTRKLGNTVELFWPQESEQALIPVLCNYVLGASFRGMRGLANCDRLLLELHLPYPRPRKAEFVNYVEEYFAGAEVFFSAKEAKLVFDARFLELKLRTFDPELRAILERKILGSINGASVSDAKDLFLSRLRALIRSNLSNRDLSSRWVARQMRFSQRTLDRHLARQGTTYKALRELIQLESAQSLLLEGFSVKQVALKVGFADVSSFVRAFRRWVGTTPGEFQKNNYFDRAGK